MNYRQFSQNNVVKLEQILTKEIERLILCYIYTQNTFLSFYKFYYFITQRMTEGIEIEAMNEIME